LVLPWQLPHPPKTFHVSTLWSSQLFPLLVLMIYEYNVPIEHVHWLVALSPRWPLLPVEASLKISTVALRIQSSTHLTSSDSHEHEHDHLSISVSVNLRTASRQVWP
jgi:hypothetical protein